MSSQPCGCDPEAQWVCDWHWSRKIAMGPTPKGVPPAQDAAQIGIGGAPTRCTILPESAAERKKYPMFSGLLAYFPDALAEVSRVSWQGNEQHNLGQPLHWARNKSADEADTLVRHLVQSGTRDVDGQRHTAKVAWRALALLQKELEAEAQATGSTAGHPSASAIQPAVP